MVKPLMSFTALPLTANGRIRSLATRSFFTGCFAVIYLNFRALPLGWMARGCEKN